MPSTYLLPKHKGRLTSSDILRGRGRNFLFGNTCFVLSEHPTGGFHLLPRSSAGRKTPISIEALTRTFSQSALAGYRVGHQFPELPRRLPFQGNVMAAKGAFLRGSEMSAHLASDNARPVHALTGSMQFGICNGYKGLDCCKRASESLKIREPRGNYLMYKCFSSYANGNNWRHKGWYRDFQVSFAAPYSAGTAQDEILNGSTREQQMQSPVVSSEQYVVTQFFYFALIVRALILYLLVSYISVAE